MSKNKPVFIEFFSNKKLLGSGYISEGSSHGERLALAISKGIKSFNIYRLDRGRVTIQIIHNQHIVIA